MKLKIGVGISFVITELAGIPSFYNAICYLELFLSQPGFFQAQPVDSVKGEIPPHGCLERAIFASVFEATLLIFVASQLAKSVGLVVTHVTDSMALVVWISIHFTFSRLVFYETQPQGGLEAASSTFPTKTPMRLVLSK